MDVDQDGHPRNIRVVRSLGKGLDQQAIKAVTQWVFEPGRKDGQPVTTPTTVEVNFSLM
jgi:periplasmic protein TonB